MLRVHLTRDVVIESLEKSLSKKLIREHELGNKVNEVRIPTQLRRQFAELGFSESYSKIIVKTFLNDMELLRMELNVVRDRAKRSIRTVLEKEVA